MPRSGTTEHSSYRFWLHAQRGEQPSVALVPEPSFLPPFDTFADPQLWLHFFLAPLFLKSSTMSYFSSPCSLSLYICPPVTSQHKQRATQEVCPSAGTLYQHSLKRPTQADKPGLCFGPWVLVSQCGLSLADIGAT